MLLSSLSRPGPVWDRRHYADKQTVHFLHLQFDEAQKRVRMPAVTAI